MGSTAAFSHGFQPPPGWSTHVYGRAAISVPTTWETASEPPCPVGAGRGVLNLGISNLGIGCPAGEFIPSVTVATMTPVPSPASTSPCPEITVNRLRIEPDPCTRGSPDGRSVWTIPELGVQVTATDGPGTGSARGPAALIGRILRTIRRATPAEIATRSPVVVLLSLVEARVRAGLPITGKVTFSNTTNEDIVVQTCAGDGWLDVGLTGNGITFAPAHIAVACLPTVVLQPGSRSFPVTVSTTYQGCSAPGPSTPGLPLCVAGDPPPLPVGVYRTEVILAGVPAVTPPANVLTVHLTR